MYVHIGNERIIKTNDIIGIFDMDRATMSKITVDYLKKAEKDKRCVTVKEEIPKSFVITKNRKIYISQISTAALAGRIEQA